MAARSNGDVLAGISEARIQMAGKMHAAPLNFYGEQVASQQLALPLP
jgi:hypothetical protein